MHGEVLHTGDLILLKFPKEGREGELCFVSCDGIVDTTAGLVTTFDPHAIPDIRDCLFRVICKLTYNAKKDFDKKILEGAQEHELELLRLNVQKEEVQNTEKLDKRLPLTYGESIQLLHVKSGKFLTIVPRQTAAFDKKARKVVLKEGSVHSAFRIQPFYQHRFIGDPIVYNEKIVLRAFKLSGWGLYAQTSEYLPPTIGAPQDLKFHELNCSTNLCGFFPMVYSRDPAMLNPASTVRLHHSRTGCFLGASCNVNGSKPPYMKKREDFNYESPLNLWSKGCWIIEPANRLQGGAFQWGSLFCLRHVGSGKYLSVKRGAQTGEGVMKDVSDPSCLLSLKEIEVVEGKDVKLSESKRAKCLIKYEDDDGELWLSARIDVLKDKPPGTQIQEKPSLKVLFAEQPRIDEAMEVECLDQSFPEYVQMVTAVVSRKAYMFRAVGQVKALPKKDATGAEGDEDLQVVLEAEQHEAKVAELFQKINEVVASSILYLTGDKKTSNALHCSSTSIAEHQRIVKDLKYIDATVLLKEALWSSGYRVDNLTSRTVVDLGIKGQVLQDPPPLDEAQLRSFRLLIEHWRACFQDNRTVEEYFDKNNWVAMLNALNGRGLGAAKALGQLLNNNPGLIRKLDSAIVEQFLAFIRDLGPDEVWLNFMIAVSSCQGVAIPSKQSFVLRMMYFPGDRATAEHQKSWSGNREDLLLTVEIGHQAVAPFPMPSNALPQMLARELIGGGIRDILVSWVTDEEPWCIGKDWLYFHPKHLDLEFKEDGQTFTVGRKSPKLWVKLADIAWVLNPELTYSVVHGLEDDAWERDGLAISKSARFNALAVLSRYFVAQMDMLAEICKDRQANAIEALETAYHFNLMVCGLYHRALAPQLRRAFCSLTIRLWLDRHPHSKIKMPNIVHKLDGGASASLTGEINTTGLPKYELLATSTPGGFMGSDFYTMSESTKFFSLFSYGKHHLTLMKGCVVHSLEGYNAYTAEVIEMMSCLADFGFIHSLDLLQEFMTAMLPCMDGRTDWLEDLDGKVEMSVAKEASWDGPNHHDFDLHSNGDNASQPLLAWTKCKCAVEDKFVKKHVSGRPLYLDIENPSEGISRYPSSRVNDKVHEIKFRMLQLCERILQFSLNSAIAKAVEIFKNEHASESSNLGKSNVTDVFLVKSMSDATVSDLIRFIKNQEYDFDRLLGGSTNTMLLDLLVYASADVFAYTMKFLKSWNHRVEITITSLQSVRLLVEPEEFKKYDLVKKNAFRLADLIQTRQRWGEADEFSDLDLDAVHECKSLLKRLREICSVGGEGNDTDVPDVGMQATLACFNLGQTLSRAFDFPLLELTGEANKHCTEIIRLTFQLCVQYVMCHPANQLEMFKQLDKIMSWFSHGLGAANVIGAIFNGNRALCEILPSSILYQFANVLQENREPGGPGFLPHQLAFLKSTIVVDQRPVPKNKLVVLKLLNNSKFDKILHLMPGREGRKRRKELLNGFTSSVELTKPVMFRSWGSGPDCEIQYHNRSIELLAMMCVGRDTTGSIEYVQAQVPLLELAAEYMDVDKVQQKSNSPDTVTMCRVLKCSLLSLLELCYYKGMNLELASQVSSIHLRLIKSFHDSLVRLEPTIEAGNMNELDCEFLIRVIKTIASYCEFVLHSAAFPEIKQLVGEDIKNVLQRLHTGKGSLPTKNELYKAVVARALGFITNDMALKSIRLLEDTDRNNIPKSMREMTNAGFQDFVTSFAHHDAVKQCIAKDHQDLVDTIFSIGSLTDATHLQYQKELQSAKDASRQLMNFEYRRNKVTLHDLMHRTITHCLVPSHLKQWETTEFALKIMDDILDQATINDHEHVQIQNAYAHSGAVHLVINILMQEPDSAVLLLTLMLGVKLLEPFNEFVQDGFNNYLFIIEDTRLWQVFSLVYEQVLSNIKYVRLLKQWKRDAEKEHRSSKLTRAESTTLEIFSRDLITCIACLRFQQLCCEGHNLKMQEYIFQQADNPESYNFVEKTVDLFSKICKNEKKADVLDDEESDVAQMALDLLAELCTGPCPRNQEFLSVSGFVETAQKLIKAPFRLLRSKTSEAYPREVRETKARTTHLLSVLIELRSDISVHRNVEFRTSVSSIKHRLMFIHRWFLGDVLNLNKAAAAVSEASGWYAMIDDPEADDGIRVPDTDPIIILDSAELVEDQLNDYFNEAFSLVVLMRALSEISEAFQEATEPSITTFKDRRALYPNEQQYLQAKRAAGIALKYHAAYNFFNRWINVIEIVVDGALFDYYFRMPMLCNFVLEHSKLHIINSISIESPENKAKDFCSMTKECYLETKHTHKLSKWSIRVPGIFHFRPFNFFLKNDSRNLKAVSEYCLGLATILNFCLFFALTLPELEPEEPPITSHYVSALRILKKKAKGKHHGGGGDSGSMLDFVSWPFMLGEWQLYVDIMGYLYTMLMFSVMLVVIATYSPLEYDRLKTHIGNQGSAQIPKTLFGLSLVSCAAFMVHSVIELPAVFAGLAGVLMLLYLGGIFAATPSSCPNNFLAKMAATASLSMNKQPVSRRVYLVVASVFGNLQVYFFYSFLLLDLVFLSPMLQNVIKAVTVPLHSLFLTTIVGLIVMYEYAIIAFYFFRRDYDGSCQSMLDCTTFTIYQGLRMDIGTAIAPTGVDDDINWYRRIGFDLSFFVVITTILMNVIFGIIIDTFGSLRDKTHEREQHMQNNTFISCIDRGEAEKAGQVADLKGSGFDFLEDVKQNSWNYLNFMFYLKRKDQVDYTGPESSVRALMDEDDVSWMPLSVCKLMSHSEEERESLEMKKFQAEVRSQISTIQHIYSDLKPMKDDIAAIRHMVTLDLKQNLEESGKEADVEVLIKKTTSSLQRHNVKHSTRKS